MNVRPSVFSPPVFLCVQIEALKQMTRSELVSWFKEHQGEKSRKLSVHVSNTHMCVFVHNEYFPLLLCASRNTLSVSLSPKGGGIWCWRAWRGRWWWNTGGPRGGFKLLGLWRGLSPHLPSPLTQDGRRCSHYGHSCFHWGPAPLPLPQDTRVISDCETNRWLCFSSLWATFRDSALLQMQTLSKWRWKRVETAPAPLWILSLGPSCSFYPHCVHKQRLKLMREFSFSLMIICSASSHSFILYCQMLQSVGPSYVFFCPTLKIF